MNKPHDEYIQTITTTQETIISMSKSLSQNYANTTKTDIRSAKKKMLVMLIFIAWSFNVLFSNNIIFFLVIIKEQYSSFDFFLKLIA